MQRTRFQRRGLQASALTGSAAEAKLATSDYALAQALNVLKGMALGRGAAVPAAK